MLRTSDSSSDEQEEQTTSLEKLAKKIKKFIQLRELDCIRDRVALINGSNVETKRKNCRVNSSTE